jgi:protocatechuate 3,4-dioxygenase beta subunit
VSVAAPPGSKIFYWAAEPEMEALKQIQDWKVAYANYENAGVATADQNGQAVLKVRTPQAYTVPFKGRIDPHIHFRICETSGMLGRIKTVFVKDGRVEGFSSL